MELSLNLSNNNAISTRYSGAIKSATSVILYIFISGPTFQHLDCFYFYY